MTVENPDTRWRQRLDNYRRAFAKLDTAIATVSASQRREDSDDIADLIREGLIQRFEYTHELAWNVMKDYEQYQGDTEVRGSRDAIRKALAIGLIDDAAWMSSITDRNRTSHNYDEDTATEIQRNIVDIYYPLLKAFLATMTRIEAEEMTSI